MQLLDIRRFKYPNGDFTYQMDLVYSTGRQKTCEILICAPSFLELTWDSTTERFPASEKAEMGSIANRDLDRIERWIEDVFDEFCEEDDVHVDNLMERLVAGIAARENDFRARFVGNFRVFRRLTYIEGITRPKVHNDESMEDIHITFSPIPPYFTDVQPGTDDLPF